MALPKEPRQLMINLMYLVLTALLAMNVSSEILNAFKTIGKSISRSNAAQDARNQATTGAFEEFLKDPKANAEKKAKVTAAKVLADQVNEKTAALIAQLEGYKVEIVKASGGYDEKGQIMKIDDLDGGTHVMIEQGKGNKMLQSMKQFKEDVAGLVPLAWDKMEAAGNGNNPDVFNNLPLSFEVEKNEENKGDWAYYNFHMSPTIANVTLIDKFISDIRGSQAAALDEIWAKATGEPLDKPETKTQINKYIHQVPRPFNDYAIIVAADNNYVLPGERFHAKIMMGTYNKALKNLSITVNGQNYPVGPDGAVDYSVIASDVVGPRELNVTARFNDTVPGTKTIKPITVTLPKPVQYFVGEAQATISLDKMNVFYVGVDNPITMSASGIQAGKLTYSAENCDITKDAGLNKYIVRPIKAGTQAKITMYGELPDGSKKTFGPYIYRVKNIPDPYPIVAGSRGGALCAAQVRVQQAIFAKLDAFDFQVAFNVVSFEISFQPKRGEGIEGSGKNFYLTGPNADPSVKAVMDAIKLGGKLYFDNIRVKMPDGRIRNIGSLMYNINC
jgi:gliding motility-associated protein GldM